MFGVALCGATAGDTVFRVPGRLSNMAQTSIDIDSKLAEFAGYVKCHCSSNNTVVKSVTIIS